jgi:hypothetical protein
MGYLAELFYNPLNSQIISQPNSKRRNDDDKCRDAGSSISRREAGAKIVE